MTYTKKTEVDGLKEAIDSSSRQYIDYDPIGLPDQTDIENINTIMRNHEKARPGEIAAFVAQAKKDRGDYDVSASGIITGSRDKSGRKTMTMPIALMRMIEESYPLMFLNKEHLAWFKKHFPMFLTGAK